MYLYWTIVCLSIVSHINLADPHSTADSDVCATKRTCGQCLQTTNCSWCMQEDMPKDWSHCYNEKYPIPCSLPYNIKSNHIETPAQHTIISPERVTLDLRINDKYRVGMKYNQPKDYPLDLYYLMDLSNSMRDDKNKLSMLALQLHETISKITADFQLGFGSFVDKALLPYVKMTKDNRPDIPCHECVVPYGFRHHLNLTKDSEHFSKAVIDAELSGNIDSPEGGFDGIVQAIVCEREIGWRSASRRLILFATDDGFHSAGDGKLGGIIAPNDGQCHLDSQGYYTDSLNTDYPSISQINRLAKMHSVNIIFAVTEPNKPVYTMLSKHIEGSTCATLNSDSSNIIQLVQDEYNTIRSTVEMKDNAPSFIQIEYYSDCNSHTFTKTNKCSGVKNGEQVKFEVVFNVIECPKDRSDWHQVVTIYPVGFKTKSMVVAINLLCECDCEREGGHKSSSEICSNNGVLRCGICHCNLGFLGKICECSSVGHTSLNNIEVYTKQCRKDDATIECSGRGTCLCGECQCNSRANPLEIFSGTYCECDNFSCERTNGQLCSGNGKCVCGKCDCAPSHMGIACDCSTSVDNCVANGVMCSGHGKCECGECECNGKYSGALCQHCPTCPGRCDDLKDCVMCHMYQIGPLADSSLCARKCNHINFYDLTKNFANGEKGQRCMYFEHECKFEFFYQKSAGNMVDVKAQKSLACPSVMYTIGIVFAVVALIVLVGLAMLFGWKLLMNIHDRREYARFVKESSLATWANGTNQLFKEPITTFKNPTFGRMSTRNLHGESTKNNAKKD